MATPRPARPGRYRWLLPTLAVGAVALLGGCVAYPADYYGSNYGYGYGYAPTPYYGYEPGPYVAFGFGGGGDWHGDRDWHGDHDGGHWGHGDHDRH